MIIKLLTKVGRRMYEQNEHFNKEKRNRKFQTEVRVKNTITEFFKKQTKGTQQQTS